MILKIEDASTPDMQDAVSTLDNNKPNKEHPVQRALSRLAADAVDLSDRWHDCRITLAEVQLRAEALARGYAEASL